MLKNPHKNLRNLTTSITEQDVIPNETTSDIIIHVPQQSSKAVRILHVEDVYNPEFVRACYVGLLNRSPNQQGFTNWVNTVNQTGDYDHVLNGFLESAEFRARFGAVDPRY